MSISAQEARILSVYSNTVKHQQDHFLKNNLYSCFS